MLTNLLRSLALCGIFSLCAATHGTAQTAKAKTVKTAQTPAVAAGVFSSAYGERWVRINFSRVGGNAWRLDAGDAFEGLGITNAASDIFDERELWCLVGNASSFKIYNRASGSTYAVTTAAKPADGSALTLTEAARAVAWRLNADSADVAKSPGYTFVVNGSDGAFAPNSYGGLTGYPVKCWNSRSESSRWNIADASATITITASTTGILPADRQTVKYAALTIVKAGSSEYRVRIAPNSPPRTAYLPDDAAVSITPRAYRDFSLTALTDGTSSSRDSLVLSPGASGKSIALNFAYTDKGARYIYYTGDSLGIPTRIPAITQAPNGHLWALSDYRFAKADIGFGDLDIIGRMSRDNGHTWGNSITLLQHDSSEKGTYGDAALVADRERNEILLMACAGRISYWRSTAEKPQDMIRCTGTFDAATGEWKWSEPEYMTRYVYHDLFKGGIRAMFIGSGKLFQSRVIKVGDYYRIYAALATLAEGNRVIYSDDFGKTWAILGGIDARPAPRGDEPKCEEFPDGTVILSSRAGGSRKVNIYTYTDAAKGEGAWQAEATGINLGDSRNGTNGEIQLTHATRTADGTRVLLALQSVPTNGRTNVSMYYKELTEADKQATEFVKGWEKYQISHSTSAYSTMDLQNDGRMGFFLEENEHDAGYDMVYIPLTLDEITGGRYTMNAAITPEAEGLSTMYRNYPVLLSGGIEAYTVEAKGKQAVATPISGSTIAPFTGVLLSGSGTYRESRNFTPISQPNDLTSAASPALSEALLRPLVTIKGAPAFGTPTSPALNPDTQALLKTQSKRPKVYPLVK